MGATSSQIQQMKKLAQMSKNFKVNSDSKFESIDSSRCFFVWDDANEMLYGITENTDIKTQAACPFKIMNIPYDCIEAVYANTD